MADDSLFSRVTSIAALDVFKRTVEEAKEKEAKNLSVMVEMLMMIQSSAKENNSRQKK